MRTVSPARAISCRGLPCQPAAAAGRVQLPRTHMAWPGAACSSRSASVRSVSPPSELVGRRNRKPRGWRTNRSTAQCTPTPVPEKVKAFGSASPVVHLSWHVGPANPQLPVFLPCRISPKLAGQASTSACLRLQCQRTQFSCEKYLLSFVNNQTQTCKIKEKSDPTPN